MLAMAKAAVDVLAEEGLDGLTLAVIATRVGVTRQLAKIYFRDKSSLIGFIAPLLRLRFQQFVIGHMQNTKDPEHLLSQYLHACFLWSLERPGESAAWFLYCSTCALNPAYRRENRREVDLGTRRIEQMLRSGAQLGVFAGGQLLARAKCIQNLITGSLTALSTEDLSKEERVDLETQTLRACFQIARSPWSAS